MQPLITVVPQTEWPPSIALCPEDLGSDVAKRHLHAVDRRSKKGTDLFSQKRGHAPEKGTDLFSPENKSVPFWPLAPFWPSPAQKRNV